jgi:phosphoribosyl-AMP cyclohydrolase
VNRAAVDDPRCSPRSPTSSARRRSSARSTRAAGEVVTHAGQQRRGLDAVAWAQEAVERGAGEILLTSIDADGTRSGYDLELTGASPTRSTVPVIASGGAGEATHLAEAFEAGAEAALVASIVHERPERLPRAEAGAEGGGMAIRDDRAELTPAIVQDADDGRVLMLAWMDEEALRRTRESGEAWFWSRSRRELWHKGETSGATLAVVELRTTATATPSCCASGRRPGLPHGLALLLRALALAPGRRARAHQARRLLRRRPARAGPAAAARKVGEEGVEAALAGVHESDERLSRSSPTSGSTATSCSRRAASTRRGRGRAL